MSRCPELACLYPLYQDPVSKLYVFAGHPDRILPRELSARLMGTFGIGNFRISLQRNVYVVYICDTSDSGLGIKTLKKQTYKERSRDVRNAQKALMGYQRSVDADSGAVKWTHAEDPEVVWETAAFWGLHAGQ